MKKLLENKKILVGITGSIAAYKTLSLIRELVKAGAEVHAILTPSAVNFVAPMTIANLTRNKVLIDMFDESSQSAGAWHIELVHSCDLMIIAPCSASTLGKIANGICDNALVTLAVAIPKETPLLVAPAMDYSMLFHPTTQRNIAQIEKDGGIIIPPEEGELSSGLLGPGRLPDNEVLMEAIYKTLKIQSEPAIKPDSSKQSPKETTEKSEETKLKEAVESSVFTLQDAVEKDKWTAEFALTKLKQELGIESEFNLRGRKILITAGPTYEKIDDVRFLGNYSSGKMGYALSSSAKELGAEVTLVSGPVALAVPAGVTVFNVESAEEMHQKSIELFVNADVAILSAAVADFTPAIRHEGKLKKNEVGDNYTIELIKTKDILADLVKIKKEKQIVVGFALESSNEIENGWKKMKEKNCDMIVVNSANKPKSGFRGDDNTITILVKDGRELP